MLDTCQYKTMIYSNNPMREKIMQKLFNLTFNLKSIKIVWWITLNLGEIKILDNINLFKLTMLRFYYIKKTKLDKERF